MSVVFPKLHGEHPRLPELRIELYAAVPEEVRRKKVIRLARPASARVYISPGHPLHTANPERLRAWARQLHRAADRLEEAHRAAEEPEQLDLVAAESPPQIDTVNTGVL